MTGRVTRTGTYLTETGVESGTVSYATADAARDARDTAFEETVSAAGEILKAELAAAGTDKAARRAAWARYGDVQDAAGAAYRAAQAAERTVTPIPKIGVPCAWTDPDTGAKTCPECGQVFPETYDADDKPATFNYATHYQCEHEESPR